MQKLRYYRQVFATGGCTTAGGGASSSGANQVGTRRKRHPPPLREKKLKEKQKNKEKDAELAQSTVVDRNPDSQEDSKPVNFISAFWLSFFSSTFFSQIILHHPLILLKNICNIELCQDLEPVLTRSGH